jgi:hypothetical protein
MQTENDTSKPEDSPQQEAGEGCSGATCSASCSARIENEICHAALKKLSACCWGQNLTQSVAGAIELIKAFRESDKRLRDALEDIRLGIENEEKNGLWEADAILGIIDRAFSMQSNFQPNADGHATGPTSHEPKNQLPPVA